ncbi:MAG: hypothetical protein ACI4HI_05865 [Lachnospiraceae bacterium]
MKKKRNCLLLLLLVVLLVPLPVQAKTQNQTRKVTKKNEDISVNVAYGLNGYANYDNPAPVTVKLKSKEDFSGQIRLTPYNSDEEGKKVVAYAENVTLPADTEKTVSMTIEPARELWIELYDKNKKLVYEEKDTLRLKSMGSNVMLGVLSDDYSALSYFDGAKAKIRTYTGTVSMLELQADTFPTDSQTLRNVQYLLIDNYDTANLSKEQYQAIKEWVSEGGILLLGTGANYQNVLHLFTDDFLSGTFDTLQKQTLTWTETDRKTKAEKLQKIEDVDTLSVQVNDAKPLENFCDDAVAFKKQYGLGAMVVLAFDLGMKPISDSPQNQQMASLLINSAAEPELEEILQNNASYQSSGYDLQNGASIAQMIDDVKKPGAVLIGGILLVYVFLVGPVLYLILKKWKKQEWIWAAIPLTAVVCLLVFYGVGSIYRIQKPLQNTFSVAWVNGGQKNETVFADVICPNVKTYRFTAEEGFQNPQVTSDYSFGYYFMENEEKNKGKPKYDVLLQKNREQTEWEIQNKDSFSNTWLSMRRVGENDIGEIKLDLDCKTDGFSGTVTNETNYDLKDVIVCFENRYYPAGNLKKGESVEIDPKKLLRENGEIVLYDYYEKMMDGNKDAVLKRNQQIDAFLEESDTYGANGKSKMGCVWAQMEGYDCNVLKKDQIIASSCGVLYQSFEADYSDITGVYYPDISEKETEKEGEIDKEGTTIYLYDDVKVTYAFEEKDQISELIDQSFGETSGDGDFAEVMAYNAEKDTFEPIFTDQQSLSKEELQRYLNHGTLILKYRLPSGGNDGYARMPRIAAKGGE